MGERARRSHARRRLLTCIGQEITNMCKLTRKHCKRELKKLFTVLAEMVAQAYHLWAMGRPAECWYEQENIGPDPVEL